MNSKEAMEREKQTKPVAYCVKCGAPNRNIATTDGNARCGRIVDMKGKRCGGAFRGAIREDDWKECPSCGATASEPAGQRSQCEGEGWLLARKHR